jgi:hypothetical protein
MHRRFARWAVHISVQAARWRMRRARLVFKLFGSGRLRLMRVAKRFWRWRVGLEAWWTWAGEQNALPALGDDRKDSYDDDESTAPGGLGWAGVNIPYVHGDESQKLSGPAAKKKSAAVGARYSDTYFLGAAMYVAAEPVPWTAPMALRRSNSDDASSTILHGNMVLTGAGNTVTAEEIEKAQRRAWFRGLASTNEQWWFWTTTAQRKAIDLVFEAAVSQKRLVAEGKRGGTNRPVPPSGRKSRSAAAAASEFVGRAADSAAMHLCRTGRRFETGPPKWEWNLPCAGALSAGSPTLRITGPGETVVDAEARPRKRLVSRNIQMRNEAKALRQLKRRMAAQKRNGKQDSDESPRRRCATLIFWMPGGTRVTVDLFDSAPVARRGINGEARETNMHDELGRTRHDDYPEPLPSTTGKGISVGDQKVEENIQPSTKKAAAAAAAKINSEMGHCEIPELFAKHLLESKAENVVANHSRAAATAADEVALEKENDIKLLHYDTVEKENAETTKKHDDGNGDVDVESVVSSVSLASSSSQKPSNDVLKHRHSKVQPTTTPPIPGERNDRDREDEHSKAESRTVMGRYDVLAVTDLLKSAPLASRNRKLRPYFLLASLARRWRNGARRPGENWLNTNTAAASVLALLHCCQSLEVAGAAAVEQTVRRMRAPLSNKIGNQSWARGGEKARPVDAVINEAATATAIAGVTSNTVASSTTAANARALEAVPPSRVYLAPHACHVAVVVDDFTAETTADQGQNDRAVAVIRHFNIANFDVALRLLEVLILQQQPTVAEVTTADGAGN